MWVMFFAAASVIFFVTGCGGSSGTGGGSGSAGLVAKGRVSLPAGFKLPISQLRVVSDSGQTAVNKDGTFASPEAAAGARMVQLVDSVSGKVVLFGYADGGSSGSPYSNGAGVISAKSTADALLFLGVLGTSLPTTDWSAFQASIFGSTFETQVAGVVSSEVVAHPTAITDGSAAIATALAAVQNTFVQPAVAPSAVLPSVSTPAARSAVQRVVVTRTITGALVEVQPVTPQSTLYVQPNPTGDGIVAVSTSRRRGAMFIYKVGAGPDTKHIAPIDPPIRVASDVEIEPTEEIKSIQAGIFQGLEGKFAYLPLTNAPVVLQPDPVQKIAVFDVVVVGPGSTDTIAAVESTVALNDAAARAEYDKDWRAALLHSQLKCLLKDVIQPLLIEFVLSSAEAGEVEADDALEEALEPIAESAPGFLASLATGNLKDAGTALMTAIEENIAGVRSKVIAALAKEFVSSGKITPAKFQTSVSTALTKASSCFAVFTAINKGIVVADITQAFHDNTSYNNADSWVADVLQPVITLTPQKSYVDTNDPLVHLAVKVQNISDLSSYRFQWTCTNQEGKLECSSSATNLGTSPIPDSTAVYVTDFTKFAVGTSDTVTVAMFAQDDLTNPIGTATAVVTAAPAPCTTVPPPAILSGAHPPIINLSEPATRPGDTLTVTVNFPADPSRDQELEVALFSAPGDFTSEANPREACKLISVDGLPAKSDYKDVYFSKTPGASSINYPAPDTTVAQTHTLVFQMLEPTDITGQIIEPYCSLKGANGGATPPSVIATGYGQNGGDGSVSYFYFNENP
jgi:hypothetical protein